MPGEINAGMYVLERSVLDLIPPGEEVSIERDVFPRLVGEGLHGLRLDGYWMDIGTPERYLQASWDILERRVETRVQPTAPGMLVGAGAEVADGGHDRPARRARRRLPGRGGAEVRDSVLLDGCVVGEGARVSGSILSAGVEVEPTVQSSKAPWSVPMRGSQPDARRHPRHPRSPARRPLAGRIGAARAGRARPA